ncbi:Hypothetical protein FKW44_011739 [Caligus rogercresseyi]|uniref:Uncharacterized protein n=1 Tax=Caligus rogercresseyi TaxID=217165 RepID=A0A7T8HIT5_CALRO|nr:Hypothetical protein FKW44_011739 [Caligus rogercresseyi]
MSILARKRGVHLSTASRVIKNDLGYNIYALKAKLVQSWLNKNVPNFWDFKPWPPNSSEYYL